MFLGRLPPASVRTAVHVQHLPSDVTSFSQIHDSLSDVLRIRDRAIGERVFMKSLGVFLWSGVSTTPGATALNRMLFFAYSFARLRVIASSPPLVIIATDAGRPAMGFSSNDAVMLVTLPPVPCDSICLTASWVMKMNPSKFVEARRRNSSAR